MCPNRCPYVVGAQLKLHVSTPQDISHVVYMTITEVFHPFTVSPVMKVRLDYDKLAAPLSLGSSSDGNLPREMVLKLFDRRFALNYREDYHLKPLTFELEAQYAAYVASGAAPVDLPSLLAVREALYENKEDAPPELLEHRVALTVEPFFESECAAYDRLSELQGRCIPTFYGTPRFCDDMDAPNIDRSVRGILLEFIPGKQLSSIDPSLVDKDRILSSCWQILDSYSDIGVLNWDVRLGNFIVKPDGSVVMIDLAQTRVRGEAESDEDWRRAKRLEDEEGAVGCIAWSRFGWEYTPTHKYGFISDEDLEYC